MQSNAGTFSATYFSEPQSVSRARAQLTEFVIAAGGEERQVEAVRLASSEALTNAVVHAYDDATGSIYVTAAVAGKELWILIADEGRGLESLPDRPGLGLGLALIAQVSEELAVVPRSGGGTEVRMRFGLRARSAVAPGVVSSRIRGSLA